MAQKTSQRSSKMNKIAIIYQSKYGTTAQYAKWLAEGLPSDLLERKNVKLEQMATYDTIIYGGGLYAGGLIGIDLLIKNFEEISDKNLIIFTCGLADPTDNKNTDAIKEGLKKIFTPEMQSKFKIFHLRGGIDYSKLGFVHKALMAMLHKVAKKKDVNTLSVEDKNLLETYGKIVDFTDKATLEPILTYVKEL